MALANNKYKRSGRRIIVSAQNHIIIKYSYLPIAARVDLIHNWLFWRFGLFLNGEHNGFPLQGFQISMEGGSIVKFCASCLSGSIKFILAFKFIRKVLGFSSFYRFVGSPDL